MGREDGHDQEIDPLVLASEIAEISKGVDLNAALRNLSENVKNPRTREILLDNIRTHLKNYATSVKNAAEFQE